MAKFRITSVYVELTQLLGTVLRDYLKFNILITECWTFIPVIEGCNQSMYLGEGNFFAKLRYGQYHPRGLNEDRVEIRTRCHLLDDGTNGTTWSVAIWLKFPNGNVRIYHYEKDSSGVILQENSQAVSRLPPSEISFK